MTHDQQISETAYLLGDAMATLIKMRDDASINLHFHLTATNTTGHILLDVLKKRNRTLLDEAIAIQMAEVTRLTGALKALL